MLAVGEESPTSVGVLYVCATPIGNLEDLSPRALRVLREASLIAAERPSHTLKLLSHYGIPGCKLRACAESTPDHMLEDLVAAVRGGSVVALVTDAGTPGVSDPAARLVQMVSAADLPVVPVPGPSALTAALSVSGFDTRRVLFLGFLSRRPGRRQTELRSALASGAVVALFESPARVRDTLAHLAALAPHRQVVVLREATKAHEQVLRGFPTEVIASLSSDPKGEFTLVVAPDEAAESVSAAAADLSARARRLLAEGLSTRDVVRALSVLCGLSRSRAFELVKEAVSESDTR